MIYLTKSASRALDYRYTAAVLSRENASFFLYEYQVFGMTVPGIHYTLSFSYIIGQCCTTHIHMQMLV